MTTPKTPCPNALHMGEFACAHKEQCWEPCGELGNSYDHARPHKDTEPCLACNGHGLIGGNTGQTPEQFSYETLPCPDCNS